MLSGQPLPRLPSLRGLVMTPQNKKEKVQVACASQRLLKKENNVCEHCTWPSTEFLAVLRFEPKALYMLGKSTTSEGP